MRMGLSSVCSDGATPRVMRRSTIRLICCGRSRSRSRAASEKPEAWVLMVGGDTGNRRSAIEVSLMLQADESTRGFA